MYGDRTANVKDGELHIRPNTLLSNGPNTKVWNFRAKETGRLDVYNVERYYSDRGWCTVDFKLCDSKGGEYLTCADPKELDRVIWNAYKKRYQKYSAY